MFKTIRVYYDVMINVIVIEGVDTKTTVTESTSIVNERIQEDYRLIMCNSRVEND